MGLFGRETNRWRCTTTENMDAPWRCCTRQREINVWTNFSNFLITKWIFPSTANTMHMEFQFSHVKIVIRDISINCASTRNRFTIEIGSYRTVNTGKITMNYIWNVSPRVIIVEFVSDRRKNEWLLEQIRWQRVYALMHTFCGLFSHWHRKIAQLSRLREPKQKQTKKDEPEKNITYHCFAWCGKCVILKTNNTPYTFGVVRSQCFVVCFLLNDLAYHTHLG